MPRSEACFAPRAAPKKTPSECVGAQVGRRAKQAWILAVSRGLFQIKLRNFYGMAGKLEWGIPVVIPRFYKSIPRLICIIMGQMFPLPSVSK